MASEQSDANVRAIGSQETRPTETSTSSTQPPRPDPLANINIPHEVLQGIADRHRAAEARRDDDLLIMDPSLGREASPQPLALIPLPSTSAIPITSSSTPQTTEDFQADDDVESQGEDATAIRKSLPVKFTDEDLFNLGGYFNIPDIVEMRLPLKGEQIFEPLVGPSSTSSPTAPGWTTMYMESLSYGERFSFSRFTNNVLKAVNRGPGQIRLVADLALPSSYTEEILWAVKSVVEPNKAVSAGQSASLGKRPTSSAPPKKPLFAKKKKKNAPPSPPPSEIVDFSEGPILEEPSHTDLGGQNDPSISIVVVQGEGSNSAHVVKRGYSTNYLPLPCTLPGGLVINESSELQRNRDSFMAVKALMLK
ncbi:hypothetical protein LIER_28148 [Lithospermum erythrorhizon]|uniref:Uncharacterized protein n=1 Tax=Lithospermum erythrorhizon TaxID=34254 RepID=A0AAV3REN2_LITER